MDAPRREMDAPRLKTAPRQAARGRPAADAGGARTRDQLVLFGGQARLVWNGRRLGVPVGVTVQTTPPNGGIASCIDRAVRGLRWQANPKTDFVTTNY